MLKVKLTGMKNNSSKYSALLYTLDQDPQMGSKGQNIFLKKVMVNIKLKEKSVEHYASLTFCTP